jgi:hypothetical protein
MRSTGLAIASSSKISLDVDVTGLIHPLIAVAHGPFIWSGEYLTERRPFPRQ